MLSTETLAEIVNSDDVFERCIKPVLSQPSNEAEKEFPGVIHTCKITELHTRHLVAKGMRHYAGGVLGTDGEDAVENTAEYLQDAVLAYLAMHCGRGVAVGEDFEAWKAMSIPQRHSVLQNSHCEYYEKSIGYAAEMVEQEGVAGVLLAKCAEVLADVANTMGFCDYEGEDLVHVWDVWRVALESLGLGAFAYGQEIGRRMSELAAFDAIAQMAMMEG